MKSPEEHYKISDFVLSVYERRASHVVALIGDKASTNRELERIVRPICIRSYSQRYYLAMHEFMGNHQPVIDKVQKLMRKRNCTNELKQLRGVTSP